MGTILAININAGRSRHDHDLLQTGVQRPDCAMQEGYIHVYTCKNLTYMYIFDNTSRRS